MITAIHHKWFIIINITTITAAICCGFKIELYVRIAASWVMSNIIRLAPKFQKWQRMKKGVDSERVSSLLGSLVGGDEQGFITDVRGRLTLVDSHQQHVYFSTSYDHWGYVHKQTYHHHSYSPKSLSFMVRVFKAVWSCTPSSPLIIGWRERTVLHFVLEGNYVSRKSSTSRLVH